MPEAHEAEGIVFVLSLLYELCTRNIADFVEHIQDGFVGTAVGGTPESRDA